MADALLEQFMSIDQRHITVGNPMQSTFVLFKKELTNSCLTLRDPTQFLIEVHKTQFLLTSEMESLIEDLYLLDLNNMGSKLSLISRLAGEVIEQSMSKAKYFFEELRALQERRLSLTKEKFCSYCRKGLLMAELQKGNVSVTHGIINKKGLESERSFSTSDIEFDVEEIQENKKIVMGIEPSDAARKLTEILNLVIDQTEEFYVDDKQFYKIGEFQQKFQQIKNKVKTKLAYTLEKTFVTIRQKKEMDGSNLCRKQFNSQGMQTTNWQVQEDMRNLQIKRDALSKALNWQRQLKQDITDKLKQCVKSLQSARAVVQSLEEKMIVAKQDIQSKKQLLIQKQSKIVSLQKSLEERIQQKEVANKKIYELKKEIFNCQNKINCLNEIIEMKDSAREKEVKEMGVMVRTTAMMMNKGLQVDLMKNLTGEKQLKSPRPKKQINRNTVDSSFSFTPIKEPKARVLKQHVQIIQNRQKTQESNSLDQRLEAEGIQQQIPTQKQKLPYSSALKKYPSKRYNLISPDNDLDPSLSPLKSPKESFSKPKLKARRSSRDNINLNQPQQLDYSKILRSSKLIQQTAKSIKGRTYSKKIPMASHPSMSFVGPIITAVSSTTNFDGYVLNSNKGKISKLSHKQITRQNKITFQDSDILEPSLKQLSANINYAGTGTKTKIPTVTNLDSLTKSNKTSKNLQENHVFINRNTFSNNPNYNLMSNVNNRTTLNFNNKSQHQTVRTSLPVSVGISVGVGVSETTQTSFFPKTNFTILRTNKASEPVTMHQGDENRYFQKDFRRYNRKNKLKLNIKSLSKYMKKSNKQWTFQLRSILNEFKSSKKQSTPSIAEAITIYDKIKILQKNNADKYGCLKSQLTQNFYRPNRGNKQNMVLISILQLVSHHKTDCHTPQCQHLRRLQQFLDNVYAKVNKA